MVFFLALCLELGEQIEKARLLPEQKISFSHRFKRDDTDYLVFDKNINFSAFQAYSNDLSQKHNVVIITDIADFYQRIYLHRIENAISSAARALPTHGKAMIQLLKGWNQNVSHGIPIGNNPSRLIAEITIDDIDRALLAEGVVFTRYVDDYRIFCNSRSEAHQILARLVVCQS